MSSFHDVWKGRLDGALTASPQSVATISRVTAVPRPSALRILRQLVADRRAVETLMPRSRPGGRAPVGFHAAPEVAA